MKFADNLKKIRKDNNLSQEQLADKLGISRQAVSKWESGQSYPEMDKVVQICNMFNVNMDELINEDINEVRERKSEKNISNKYVKSFFSYLTKVVDMFYSMKFKQLLLCLIEQVIICLIIFMLLCIVGSIGHSVVLNMVNFLPDKVYSFIYYSLKALFIVCGSIIGITSYLHIFKIRYLDYYEDNKYIVLDEEKNEKDVVDKNIVIDNKKENVIIRDPKDSGFSFISGLAKVVLFFIKFIAIWLLVGAGAVVFSFAICIVLCFFVFKSGLLFWGLLLFFLGSLLVSCIVFDLLFDFIFNRRVNKIFVLLVSIFSLIGCGIGIGLATLSVNNFEYVEVEDEGIVDKYEVDMNDELIIFNNFGNIEYIEKDIDNVEIVVKHSSYDKSELVYRGNYVNLYLRENGVEIFNAIKYIISSFNDKKVLAYNFDHKVYVYANIDNLKRLKNNYSKYSNEVDRLEKENEVLTKNNRRLENYINESCEAIVSYDEYGYIVDIDD